MGLSYYKSTMTSAIKMYLNVLFLISFFFSKCVWTIGQPYIGAGSILKEDIREYPWIQQEEFRGNMTQGSCCKSIARYRARFFSFI